MEAWVYYFGLGAVAVNAATGVLEAGRKPIDLFGMVVVALAAALGGGTIRDVLLDRSVFWIADVTYLYTAFLAGVATFALVRLVRLPPNLFLLPDAVGLALFTILGTEIALAFGAPWFTATLLGVITGVFGGVLRDILCNEVPLVFSGQLYATAAWTGAVVLVGARAAGVEGQTAAWIAFCAILAIRLAALRWHIGLPVFTARK
ncbi:MAG TPA: trimeric intracellular cation channel family protein [Pelomicrobium sp.]|nr:trimeric intracellular cation channel family protein [Pelomicrobium sp.]